MNSGIGTLIDNLQARGFSVVLISGVVKVQGDRPPDQDAVKLLDELKQRKDEVKAILSQKPCWNCGASMTAAKDIYGRDLLACDHCSVSSDDLLQCEHCEDDPHARIVKRVWPDRWDWM